MIWLRLQRAYMCARRAVQVTRDLLCRLSVAATPCHDLPPRCRHHGRSLQVQVLGRLCP